MSTQLYDFTLAAAVGASQRIDVAGSQFLVRAAAGGPVKITTDTGKTYVCNPGQGANLKAGQFNWLLITNLQAVANAGAIFAGDDEYVDRRITGTVTVIDQSTDKTQAGTQFASIAVSTAQIGLVSAIGVCANSRKTAVRSFKVSSSQAGSVALGFCTSQGTGLATTAVPVSKLNAAAVASHRAAFGTLASASPTAPEMPGWAALGLITLAANTMTELVFDTPFVLTGTNCMAIIGQVTNRDLFLYANTEELA